MRGGVGDRRRTGLSFTTITLNEDLHVRKNCWIKFPALRAYIWRKNWKWTGTPIWSLGIGFLDRWESFKMDKSEKFESLHQKAKRTKKEVRFHYDIGNESSTACGWWNDELFPVDIFKNAEICCTAQVNKWFSLKTTRKEWPLLDISDGMGIL